MAFVGNLRFGGRIGITRLCASAECRSGNSARSKGRGLLSLYCVERFDCAALRRAGLVLVFGSGSRSRFGAQQSCAGECAYRAGFLATSEDHRGVLQRARRGIDLEAGHRGYLHLVPLLDLAGSNHDTAALSGVSRRFRTHRLATRVERRSVTSPTF